MHTRHSCRCSLRSRLSYRLHPKQSSVIPVQCFTNPASACVVNPFQHLVRFPMNKNVTQVYAMSVCHNWWSLELLGHLIRHSCTCICLLTILWISGRCFEYVSTRGTLSSFLSLDLSASRADIFSVSTFCTLIYATGLFPEDLVFVFLLTDFL